MHFLTKRGASAAIFWALGCAVLDPHTSAVGRAELYTTGEKTYDGFFQDLHTQQVEVADAGDRELALRRELGDRYGTEDLSPEGLAGSVKVRAASLASSGTKLRLEADSDPEDEDASVRLEVLGNLSDADRRLVEVVATTARGELGLLVEMTRREHELDRLGALAEGLERSTTRVFANRSLVKAHQVRQNLEDARTIIALLRARADTVQISARRTLKKLMRATTTAEPSATAAPPPPPPPSEPEETKSAPKPPPKPSAPRVKPSAQPKPSARPGPDFEP
jgi:hypothetical protein